MPALPSSVVDLGAGCASVKFYQFYSTTSISTPFTGTLFDDQGQTIGSYSAGTGSAGYTNFGVGGVFSIVSIMSGVDGVVTWGTNTASGRPSAGLAYNANTVVAFNIPTAIAATLRYNTGKQSGVAVNANSPLVGTMTSFGMINH